MTEIVPIFNILLRFKLGIANWKIKHYVLSATIPNDLMKQVIDLKHQTDSLNILLLKSTVK